MTLQKGSLYFHNEAYSELLDYLSKVSYSKLFILVDENTRKYCLPVFKKHFSQDADILEIPSGEKFKNMETLQLIWQNLTDLNADRNSILINLGGGVISDLGGFAALTFKRGMRFINVPTTLLGMVDAAIGGKTGIDFHGLKNHIGIISQPVKVLIDPSYLYTLTTREYVSGMAEVFKYGLIADEELWQKLSDSNELYVSEKVIEKAANIKKKIVDQDEQETGLRKILNFGHTLGHAIETYFMSKPQEKQLLHGEAVAIGMIMSTHISHQKLGFPEIKLHQVTDVLCKRFPKIEIDRIDQHAIIKLLIHDKKNFNGQLNFVLLEDIAKPVWDCEVTEIEINKAITFYLNQK